MTTVGAVCQGEWSRLRPAVFMSALRTVCCCFSHAGLWTAQKNVLSLRLLLKPRVELLQTWLKSMKRNIH